MSNYFKTTGYCSNSALSGLEQKSFFIDSTNAYRLGSLLDAVVTERHLINVFDNKIRNSDYTFTDFELKQAQRMHDNLKSDDVVKVILDYGETQKEIYSEMSGIFEGIPFTIPMKGKLDFDCSYNLGMIADLKRTFAKTQSQFEKAFDFFKYYRQAFIYMNLAKVDKMIFFAANPHNNNVFKITINKNDANYRKGQESFNTLGFKWWLIN